MVETLDTVEGPSIAAQHPVLLADYLSSMQAKTFSKMSSIELADVQIPGTCASILSRSMISMLTLRQRAR